jgi:hypothetical protein
VTGSRDKEWFECPGPNPVSRYERNQVGRNRYYPVELIDDNAKVAAYLRISDYADEPGDYCRGRLFLRMSGQGGEMVFSPG